MDSLSITELVQWDCKNILIHKTRNFLGYWYNIYLKLSKRYSNNYSHTGVINKVTKEFIPLHFKDGIQYQNKHYYYRT